MKSSNSRRAVAFLASIAVSFAALTTAWVSAAHATESRADISFEVEVVLGQSPARQHEMRCFRKILNNGRKGETVLVCDSGARQ